MHKNVLMVIACALAFAACAGPRPQAVKRVAGGEVALYLAPAITGESNEMRILVRGGTKPEIPYVALSMPAMPGMPVERVSLSSSGDGSYRAGNLRFSMSGLWHVAVIERRHGVVSELTSFDIPVR